MGITLGMVAMYLINSCIFSDLFLKHVQQHEFPCVKSPVKGLKRSALEISFFHAIKVANSIIVSIFINLMLSLAT